MSAVADPKGYYRVLGLSPTASAEDVRVAFRAKARIYHPDQGGPQADEAQFQRIREAYDVLRDARSRMRYDAERLAVEEPVRRAPPVRGGGAAWVSRLTSVPVAGAAAVALAILVLVLITMLGSAYSQLEDRSIEAQQLYDRLAVAAKDQADMRARYRGANFIRLDEAISAVREGSVDADRFVFHAELEFEQRSSEVDENLRKQLDRAILDLADTIADIPADRDWLILLDGHSGEAAGVGGVAVDAWELSLLRLGSIVDHLVANGMPTERLAVRFLAGFQPTGEMSSEGGTVEVKLLCCYK